MFSQNTAVQEEEKLPVGRGGPFGKPPKVLGNLGTVVEG